MELKDNTLVYINDPHQYFSSNYYLHERIATYHKGNFSTDTLIVIRKPGDKWLGNYLTLPFFTGGLDYLQKYLIPIEDTPLLRLITE